ncbi:MAG: hypothetical protein IPP78_15720 [Holophagaceae bacterium]|nr:hypothetical protein [Holophagaceae bacterium]
MSAAWLLSIFITVSLPAQDWQLYFEREGEKFFVDYTPELISINGSMVAVSREKIHHGIEYDIITWYYRVVDKRLQIARKSQIGYFKNGSIQFSAITIDTELDWSFYQYQNNPHETKVLKSVFKVLKFQGPPLKP